MNYALWLSGGLFPKAKKWCLNSKSVFYGFKKFKKRFATEKFQKENLNQYCWFTYISCPCTGYVSTYRIKQKKMCPIHEITSTFLIGLAYILHKSQVQEHKDCIF